MPDPIEQDVVEPVMVKKVLEFDSPFISPLAGNLAYLSIALINATVPFLSQFYWRA